MNRSAALTDAVYQFFSAPTSLPPDQLHQEPTVDERDTSGSIVKETLVYNPV